MAAILAGPMLVVGADDGADLEAEPVEQPPAPQGTVPVLAEPEWTGDAPPVPDNPLAPDQAQIDHALEVIRSSELVTTTLKGDFQLLNATAWNDPARQEVVGIVMTVQTPEPVSLPPGTPAWAPTGEGAGEVVDVELEEAWPATQYFDVWVDGDDEVQYIAPYPEELAARFNQDGSGS